MIDALLAIVLFLLVLEAVLPAESAGKSEIGKDSTTKDSIASSIIDSILKKSSETRSSENGSDTPTTRRITARSRAHRHPSGDALHPLHLPRPSPSYRRARRTPQPYAGRDGKSARRYRRCRGPHRRIRAAPARSPPESIQEPGSSPPAGHAVPQPGRE